MLNLAQFVFELVYSPVFFLSVQLLGDDGGGDIGAAWKCCGSHKKQ